LTAGRPFEMDAIEVQTMGSGGPVTRHAFLFAAAGFACDLVSLTTSRIKRVFGRRLAYSVGFLRALRSFQAPEMTVESEGRRFTGPMFHVCAGNAEYGGGGVMRLSPGARYDDGLLDMCVIPRLNRIEIVQRFPGLMRGTHIRHPAVEYFRARSIGVRSQPRAGVQVDGEVIGHTPATFTLRPKALRVMAPASWAGQQVRVS